MINFKAHPNLANKPPETLIGIEHCVKNRIPFVLFDSTNQYVVFLVAERKIIVVDYAERMMLDGYNGEAAYLERIKFYLMAYENFQEVPQARIENNALFLQ